MNVRAFYLVYTFVCLSALSKGDQNFAWVNTNEKKKGKENMFIETDRRIFTLPLFGI